MTAKWIEELARPMFSETADVEGLERARLRRAALRAFERALPPLYRWARFESPLIAERVKLAIPRELPSAQSVVIMGPPGIGKTSLAVALLHAMLKGDLATATLANEEHARSLAARFRFVHAHRLGVARINGAEGLADLKIALHATVLLLDDLGSDPDIPSNAVPEVIQERHAGGRTTWITTAFSRSEIGERYGGGIARRLLEHGHFVRHASAHG